MSGKREHETFHYAVLFYSVSLIKEAKRPVSVGFRTNYRQVQGQIFIFISGKAEKTNNNERSSQEIPLTSRSFLKCEGTYFLTSVGICKYCNVW